MDAFLNILSDILLMINTFINNNHFIDTWDVKQGLWVILTNTGTDNEWDKTTVAVKSFNLSILR